jgi:hypothetical protein
MSNQKTKSIEKPKFIIQNSSQKKDGTKISMDNLNISYKNPFSIGGPLDSESCEKQKPPLPQVMNVEIEEFKPERRLRLHRSFKNEQIVDDCDENKSNSS